MDNFVTFEIGKKLKEKGFIHGYNLYGYKPIYTDVNTIVLIWNNGAYEKDYFGENIPCPTISQVLKWLREEKNIHIEIYTNASGYNYIISDTPKLGGSDKYWSDYEGPNDSGCWDFYEQAALAGIEYVLDKELIKL